MNDRELKAAAVGIITYCYIMQTGKAPELDAENQMMEAGAFLDNAVFDKTLELCSYADMDSIELTQEDDE